MRLNQRLCALALAAFIFANSPNSFAAQQSASNQAQLYFFTNAGCAPCRQVAPEIEQLYREGYRVMKIDTSIHPNWTARFQVTKTPTVVMVSGNEIVGRKSGYIDANTLRRWFKLVDNASNVAPNASASGNSKANASESFASAQPTAQRSIAPSKSNDPTKGTFKPANDFQRNAMQATVRLRIDDPEGSSYATGTVIHSFEGEALVLTCGHVFRDSNGKGRITAEYGFLENQPKVASGELLFYDAKDRDIGLVAISTDGSIEPVSVATISYPIQKGDQIFSIGCDHGERPSIRTSRMKNMAKYDGVNKYEIYGRPVNGRSGGGMFTSGGQLVGVCNAAVVDEDEGVYVALDTIHWQIAQANLTHLFDNKPTPMTPRNQMTRLAQASPPKNAKNNTPLRSLDDDLALLGSRAQRNQPNEVKTNNVVNVQQPKTELILVLRNQNAQGGSESWTVNNPSDELVQALKRMGTNNGNSNESTPNRMAELRRNMPNLQNVNGKTYNSNQMRAQSPR